MNSEYKAQAIELEIGKLEITDPKVALILAKVAPGCPTVTPWLPEVANSQEFSDYLTLQCLLFNLRNYCLLN